MSGHNPELWKRNEPVLQTDFLVREKVLPILGNVTGMTILDAGCGEGYVSRKLAEAGAVVEAFDNDPEMITLAKESGTQDGKITYKIGKMENVDELYPRDYFDAVVVSGVICFLDQKQLLASLKKLNTITKVGGRILIATNHTDSYFKKAKSRWLEYLSEPNVSKKTQEVSINFNNAQNERLFTGRCYFHTPDQVTKTLEKAGFQVTDTYAPLATKEDMSKFSHMWIDENKTPYHLIVIGTKE